MIFYAPLSHFHDIFTGFVQRSQFMIIFTNSERYKQMKKIISVVSLTLIGLANYAMAADADKGEKIFNTRPLHEPSKNIMKMR